MQNETQNSGKVLPEDDLSQPYQVIAHFFDYSGVSGHREEIATWMEAVNKRDYWRESCSSDLLFYYEKLVILIKAIHIIYKENKKRKTAVDLLEEKGYDAKKNLLHPALFIGWTRRHTLWNYFPRSLSREEYIDPYLVFPRFFAVYGPQEWCRILHGLLSDGLSSDKAIEAYGPEYDMLLIQKNLFKLVEAAHLIDVREVDHIGDFKKRPPYTLEDPPADIPLDKIFGMILPEDENNIEALFEDDEEGPDEETEEEENEYAYEGEDNDEKNENDDEEAYRNDDDNNEEETGKGSGKEKGVSSGPAFLEVMIRGNCTVNDRLLTSEPVKIHIPINTSTADNQLLNSKV